MPRILANILGSVYVIAALAAGIVLSGSPAKVQEWYVRRIEQQWLDFNWLGSVIRSATFIYIVRFVGIVLILQAVALGISICRSFLR
jgi:hypothetical protein